MKYNMTARMLGAFYHKRASGEMTKAGIDKATQKKIKKEYKAIVLRAKDIGKANLISSYFMGAYFIAMNRADGKTPDENYEMFKVGLMSSKMFKKMMGDAKSYFDPKRTAKRKEWSKYTHERKYENDWVVDILDRTDDYELGYNYTECGVCKLFRDEGVPEWAHYLCMLDFPMADMMGMRLERTKTLADGGDMCDFRYSYKK